MQTGRAARAFVVLLLAASVCTPGAGAAETPSLPEFIPREHTLHAAAAELLASSGLPVSARAGWLVTGSLLAPSVSVGEGAVVSPPWIGLSASAPSESGRGWELLFSALSTFLRNTAALPAGASASAVRLEGDMTALPSGTLESAELVAPGPLLAAVTDDENGTREFMLPVKFSGSGGNRVVMFRASVYRPAAAARSACERGDELELVYRKNGVSVRFRGRVESVDPARGAVSLRPFPSIFRDERGLRRFELRLDGSGPLDIVRGEN